ncbi:putative SAGA-associated factor 11-like [Penaeus vannamei]|uniref:SAGA-associated factor 11 homolog n=1 Tax=Penaeus vannamei TaxID=6689 RepID=A0A3R7LZW6_PENVA|nr:putative SAGA-associated factor 11-like [Penaeus vannamei]
MYGAHTRTKEQVSNTGSWMVQAGGGGGGGRVGVDNNVLLSSLASPEALEAAAQSVSQELLDDAILNVVFEVHQSVKTGLMMLEVGSVEEEQKFLQVNAEGLDVFGQAPIKKQHECICPNCSRNLAASRFAPHLEKCMGMGRNSSRIASRRIQNSTKENSNSHHGGSDDDDDDDWMIDRKRKRRDKNSPRRSKNAKVKGDSVSSSSNVETTLATGTTEEKRAMLKQICGVFNGSGSETTTTTRAADSTSRSLGDTAEDIHVDIDGLDDGQLASSWDNDHSNTTSPADSTSTNNSTSSLAKRNGSKSKKKSSKSSKSSSSSHGSLLD